MTPADPRRDGALDLLSRHRPADDREAKHLSDAIELVRATGFPFDRDRFEPGHLTASGFVSDGARVLLVHHRVIGTWLQPGGHIDPDDPDAAAAALREIVEETGVTGLTRVGDGLLDVDLHTHPGKPGREPPHLHFDLRFGFLASDRGLSPSDEVTDAGWFGPDDIAALGCDESVTRAVGTLIRRLAAMH